MHRTVSQSQQILRPVALCVAGFVALLAPHVGLAQARPRITSAVDESRLVTLAGNTHPLARKQFDLGLADTSGRMLLTFKRSSQQEGQLQQLLRDQQNAASPQFHKWLTPSQFGDRFGIAGPDLEAITGYLQQKGLAVGRISPGRMSIEITGSSAQVLDAFHTEMHRYSAAGQEFYSNDRDPQIPQALAAVVAGVASMNNYSRKLPAAARQVTYDVSRHSYQPLYTFVSGGVTQYGVSPQDLAVIYNIPAQAKPLAAAPSIAVISDSNVNLASIAAYASLFKLQASAPSVIIDGQDPGIGSNALTTTEELELLSAVAPYASLNLYTAATSDYDTGIDFSIVRAVSDDTANIIDFGFLGCESSLGTVGNQFASALWEQAAAQGMTVISATGDAGASACDLPGGMNGLETTSGGLAVNGWASTPYNTAVGGTDFYYTSAAQTGNYWTTGNSGTPAFLSARGVIPQQPWNDSEEATDLLTLATTPLYGSGGGSSTLGLNGVSGYPVPTWQTAALGSLAATRSIPDLSLFAGDEANGSYYVLCFAATDCANGTSSTFTAAGGTAGAASVFAGVMAQVVQRYQAQGNINRGLYALAATSTSASFASTTAAFYDVTAGTNYVACGANCAGSISLTLHGLTASYLGFPAGSGYDLASGLGTINAGNLIANWPGINSETAPGSVVLGVSSGVSSGVPTPVLSSGATISHGALTFFNVTVAAAGGKGTPTGDVAIVSSNFQAGNKSIGRLTLTGGAGNDFTNAVQLPGGTYTLAAQYAGDANYAPAASAPFTITVNPEVSQTVIMSASANPVGYTNFVTNLNFSLITSPAVAYGTPVRITVEPFGLEGNSVGIPSGSITVFDGGTPITSIALNSEGAATFQSNTLAVGAHSFTFSYAGDSSYQASTSLKNSAGAAIFNNFLNGNQAAVSFTVASAATHTALSASSADLFTSGGNSTLTAVVSSASTISTGFAPGGQVQFKLVNSTGGVTLTNVSVTPGYDSNGNLVGVANEKVSAIGTYSATYLPTGNFVGSASNALLIIQTVCNLYCTTTNTTTTLSTVTGANTYSTTSDLVFNIQVVATPLLFGYLQSGIYTNVVSGSVNIFANGVQIGLNVPLNPANGTATFTVPKNGDYLQVPSGNVVFTAAYAGGTATALGVNFAAEASTGADPLVIQGNADGNANTPSLSGDFSLQTLQTAQLMPAGTSGSLSFPVQLAAMNGFAQNYAGSSIALSCSSSTPGLTCSLSAGSLGLSGGYNTVTATVTPSANYTVAQNDGPAASPRWWFVGGGAAMGCVLLLGIPARRRSWQAMLGMMLLCITTVGMGGCAGNAARASADSSSAVRPVTNKPTSVLPGSGSGVIGKANGFTPQIASTLAAGTYPVTVSGSVMVNGALVTHSTQFNVVVH